MMLLEGRGIVKTAKELRAMVSTMDVDNNHRLSFVEWCCAIFERSYQVDSIFFMLAERHHNIIVSIA